MRGKMVKAERSRQRLSEAGWLRGTLDEGRGELDERRGGLGAGALSLVS
jgi:hypothetical protein